MRGSFGLKHSAAVRTILWARGSCELKTSAAVRPVVGGWEPYHVRASLLVVCAAGASRRRVFKVGPSPHAHGAVVAHYHPAPRELMLREHSGVSTLTLRFAMRHLAQPAATRRNRLVQAARAAGAGIAREKQTQFSSLYHSPAPSFSPSAWLKDV